MTKKLSDAEARRELDYRGHVMPTEIWIDADIFDEDGKIYEAHKGRVRAYADPDPEQFAYPEGYLRFGRLKDEEFSMQELRDARTTLRQEYAESLGKVMEQLEEIYSPDQEGQSLEDQRAYDIECAGKAIEEIDALLSAAGGV